MFSYRLIRKKRKTLSIKVQKDGAIVVSVPIFCPQSEIDAFLRKNTAWIERKRAEVLSQKNRRLAFVDGEKVPFFGTEYPIRLVDASKATLSDGAICLPAVSPRAGLEKLYRRELTLFLSHAISVYEEKMNIRPTGVRITSARTRWGSCSGKNSLSFSFFLAMCEPSAIEYVVVHELCHIVHKDHSPRFWAAAESFFPACRAERAYLKAHAYFMDLLD